MTQTTDAFHSYTNSITNTYAHIHIPQCFSKCGLQIPTSESPCVLIKMQILETYSRAMKSEYAQNNSLKYSIG